MFRQGDGSGRSPAFVYSPSQGGLLVDRCDNCIQLKTFPNQWCPTCKGYTVRTELQGLSIFIYCPSCDRPSVAGGSYWPNCALDKTEFTLTLSFEEKSNRQFAYVGRTFHLPFLEARKLVLSDAPLPMTFGLYKLRKLLPKLDADGVSYQVDPPIAYSLFWKCAWFQDDT